MVRISASDSFTRSGYTIWRKGRAGRSNDPRLSADIKSVDTGRDIETQRPHGSLPGLLSRLWWAMLLVATGVAAADPELHVDEAQGKRAAIEKPAPPYPLAARQLKISGEVRLEAVVSIAGTVE